MFNQNPYAVPGQPIQVCRECGSLIVAFMLSIAFTDLKNGRNNQNVTHYFCKDCWNEYAQVAGFYKQIKNLQ